MNAIEKVRLRLHEYFLQRDLRKTPTPPHYSIDFQEAKNIGVLFDATELGDREIVEQYAGQLRKSGKKVKLLGFLNERQKQNSFSFFHFSRKELDVTFRPNDAKVKEFINRPFDILLNLYTSSHQPLEYISALSKSTFRVGPMTDKTYCFDLMIHTNNQNDLQHFIHQIEFFLKKIQKQHEANAI